MPKAGWKGIASNHACLLVCSLWAAAVVVSDSYRIGLDLKSVEPAGPSLNCKRIHSACARCANSRVVSVVNGTKTVRTVATCSGCEAGWRLRKKDLRTPCECAPGLYNQDLQCVPCLRGKFCLGGGQGLLSDCPNGLATIIIGAKSRAQCMSTPGFGRVQAKDNITGQMTLFGVVCPIGTYNIGGNTGGCQPCNIGLTTTAIGSSSFNACVAPPGWYISSGVGKMCPKGTYTTEYNQASFCTACPTAVTTATEGSNTSTACSRAIRGFYFNATDGNAVPCPIATYQDVENPNAFCKPCPRGLQTKAPGAIGVEMCTTPPGWELLPGAVNMTLCPKNSFKETWAMEPCTSCITGLLTNEAGSYNRFDCYIPPGWGLARVFGGPSYAVLCTRGTFGRAEPNHDTTSAAGCITCQVGMTTLDILTNTTAENGYTTEEDCLTLPGYGFDPGTIFSTKCGVGFWSAGSHRGQCTPCPAAFTTLGTASTNQNQCVIQPGWGVEASSNLARPCDVGWYSPGGTLSNTDSDCLPCQLGYSTQRQESESLAECNVCAPGWGSDDDGGSCNECPYNTYSYGGTSNPCIPCPVGTASERGAAMVQSCVDMWPLMDASVYIHASSDSFWTDSPSGAATVQDCQAQCSLGCIMFRYREAPNQCLLLMELTPGSGSYSNRAAVGWKALADGVVHDYAFYYVPAQLTIGTLLKDLGPGLTLHGCMDACSLETACIVIRVTGNSLKTSMDSCQLFGFDIDTDFVSVYRVDGSRLFHDGFIMSVSTESLSTGPLSESMSAQVWRAQQQAMGQAAATAAASSPGKEAAVAAAKATAGKPLL